MVSVTSSISSLGTASTITCVDADTEETMVSEGDKKGGKWVSVLSESTPTTKSTSATS